MRRKVKMLGVLAMISCVLFGGSAFGALVYDNYDRSNSDSLGSTQATDGAISYAWNDGGASTVKITSNELAFDDYSGTHGAAVAGFTVDNASISLDLVSLNESKPTGVVYRARTEAIARDIYATDRNSGTSKDAYSVQIWGGPNSITAVLLYRDGGAVVIEGGLDISLASPQKMVFRLLMTSILLPSAVLNLSTTQIPAAVSFQMPAMLASHPPILQLV